MSDHKLAEALRTGLEAALELLAMKGAALGHDSRFVQTYKDTVAELREALAAHEAEQQAGWGGGGWLTRFCFQATRAFA